MRKVLGFIVQHSGYSSPDPEYRVKVTGCATLYFPEKWFERRTGLRLRPGEQARVRIARMRRKKP